MYKARPIQEVTNVSGTPPAASPCPPPASHSSGSPSLSPSTPPASHPSPSVYKALLSASVILLQLFPPTPVRIAPSYPTASGLLQQTLTLSLSHTHTHTRTHTSLNSPTQILSLSIRPSQAHKIPSPTNMRHSRRGPQKQQHLAELQ